MTLLEGRTVLVMGVANKRSIAWGAARACADAGAHVVLSYAVDRLEDKVRGLAEELPSSEVHPCDVTQPDQVEALFGAIDDSRGTLHGLVHSIAFARTEDLKVDFVDTDWEGWKTALQVSAYSLPQLCRHAAPLMTDGGSVVAMTFVGSVRVVPGYNVMGVAKAALEAAVRYSANDLGPKGIRVNGISSGPIRTLSAAAIPKFGKILDHIEEWAPLRRNVEPEDVGGATAFLLSDLAGGITGDIIHVDAGYHIMGV